MAVTSIDIDKVKSQTHKLQNITSQLHKEVSNLKNANANCEQFWDSNAGKAFHKKTEKLTNDFIKTVSKLDQLNTSILNIALKIQREDERMAKSLSLSKGD